MDAVTLGSQLGKVAGLQPRLITPFPQVPLKEGGVTTFQVKVLVQVTVCPQAVASKVKIWVRLHPLMAIVPALQFTVTDPQEFEAVTAPPKFPPAIPTQVGSVFGLQPRLMVLFVQLAKTGVGEVGGNTVNVA